MVISVAVGQDLSGGIAAKETENGGGGVCCRTLGWRSLNQYLSSRSEAGTLLLYALSIPTPAPDVNPEKSVFPTALLPKFTIPQPYRPSH